MVYCRLVLWKRKCILLLCRHIPLYCPQFIVLTALPVPVSYSLLSPSRMHTHCYPLPQPGSEHIDHLDGQKYRFLQIFQLSTVPHFSVRLVFSSAWRPGDSGRHDRLLYGYVSHTELHLSTGPTVILAVFTFALHPYYWPVIAMGDSPPLATRAGWISIGILPFMLYVILYYSCCCKSLTSKQGILHENKSDWITHWRLA